MGLGARSIACAAILVTLAGCDAAAVTDPTGPSQATPSYVARAVGPGPRYRPPPGPPRPLGPPGPTLTRSPGLPCAPAAGSRRAFHLELFAHRRVIVIPAGVGVAAARRAGPYVTGGRCFYPLITLEPTGVVELAPVTRRLRLGDFFAVWGQPLAAARLAGFAGAAVRAYVGGRPVAGDPAQIVLRPHLEIVLEIAGHVPPHRSYGFAPGL